MHSDHDRMSGYRAAALCKPGRSANGLPLVLKSQGLTAVLLFVLSSTCSLAGLSVPKSSKLKHCGGRSAQVIRTCLAATMDAELRKEGRSTNATTVASITTYLLMMQVDTEAVRAEKQEAIARVEAAVEAALSSLHEQLPLGDRKRKDAPAGGAPAKRGHFMGMDDGSSTDSSDSEIEFEDAGGEAPDAQAPESQAPKAPAARSPSAPAASTGSDRSEQDAGPGAGASSAAAALASPTGLSAAAAANVASLPAAAAAVKQPAVAQPPEDPAAEHKHVDLNAFGSAQELESLGLDVLKAELQRLGLKCGGRLEQRAARLFLLKGTPLAKIAAEHKPAKKN